MNVTLRKKLKTYANLRPCISFPNIKDLIHQNVHIVTIRENVEGEYAGKEHEVVPGVVENFKIITQEGCTNISRFALNYAKTNSYKKLTCSTKKSISMSDEYFY